MSAEDDDLIEQNSEEIDIEDDNEEKVAIVEEAVELSEPGRIIREEVTRVENPSEFEEEAEKGSIIGSNTTRDTDYVAKQLEEQTHQIKKLADTIPPLQKHVQGQFEMLQDIQSKLNRLQTAVQNILESKKITSSKTKQPTKKIGNRKKHTIKKSAKRTKSK
jgi:hypothetical protein